MGQDTVFNFSKQGLHHGFPGNHHNIHAGFKPVLVAAEHFPDLPLGAVSLDGVSYLFGCNDAQPFPASVIREEKQEAKFIDAPFSPKVHHPFEIGSGQKPVFLGKGLLPHG